MYRARNDAGDGVTVCFRTRMPNLYLLTKADGSSDEISADSYEREGDDWLFALRGDVVARIPIDDIASIVRRVTSRRRVTRPPGR